MSNHLKSVLVLAAIGCGGSHPQTPAQPPRDLGLPPQPSPTPAPLPARLGVDDDAFQFDPLTHAGQASPQAFTFVNQGALPTGPLEVTLHGDDVASFALTHDDCKARALGGGERCQVIVTMTSSAGGPLQATLRVRGEPGGLVKVQLSGRVTPGALSITPSGGKLAAAQGDKSGTLALHVANSGAAPSGALTVAAPAELTLDDGCSGKSLAGGEGCDLSLTIGPALDATPGDVRALVEVRSASAGDATAAVLETVLLAASLRIDPMVFGANDTDVTHTIQVTNVGGVASRAVAVQLTGIDVARAYWFSTGSDGCTGKALAPNDHCDVEVRFEPGGTSGVKRALLHAAADGAHGGEALITGLAAHPALGVYINISGSGRGTVTLEDGQSCAGSCTFGIDASSDHTLLAHPDASSTVGHWNLPGCVDGNPLCSFKGSDRRDTSLTFVAK